MCSGLFPELARGSVVPGVEDWVRSVLERSVSAKRLPSQALLLSAMQIRSPFVFGSLCRPFSLMPNLRKY